MNKRELDLGLSGTSTSWHAKYKDSAWIFIGGLPYDLTEGDVICVFSQYGEIVNINLVRDKKTGKSLGYGFICYEDTRSPILAVDNFNGIKLLNRTIRVDHVENYRAPKEDETSTTELKKLRQDGCAPQLIVEEEEPVIKKPVKIKVEKEEKIKKEKKAKKKKKKRSSSLSSSESMPDESRHAKRRRGTPSPPGGGDPVRIKTEKTDRGYDLNSGQSTTTTRDSRGRPDSRTDRSRSCHYSPEYSTSHRSAKHDKYSKSDRHRKR
ncbi:uncharacterized protein LOC141911318 isoform X2 [Tubulanus polymorphus]